MLTSGKYYAYPNPRYEYSYCDCLKVNPFQTNSKCVLGLNRDLFN